jgi:toxin YoeB
MGKYFVEFDTTVQKDLRAIHKSGNKSLIKKLEKILIELTNHPYEGEGHPEELKYELKGYWSRRINKKDRIIYRVEENIVTVFIVAIMGHYSDK